MALLVSHDGARWLPAVIDGVRSQTSPVRGVVAVDTGSKDESVDLLVDAFDEVVTVTGRTAYPEAVRIALEQVDEVDGADSHTGAEWIWLLHDDSNPAPDALERLLAAAGSRDVQVVVPRPGERVDVLAPPPLTDWWTQVGSADGATGPAVPDEGRTGPLRRVGPPR